MKFEVDRLVGWGSRYIYSRSPCEEAVRDEGGFWFVDIESMDCLMQLVQKHGDLLITEQGISSENPLIRICEMRYDDYIE